MGDEERYVPLKDVIAQTGLNKNKIRALADAGYLMAWRAPRTGRGWSHRRFSQTSVDRLKPILRIPDGPERDAMLEALRRQNLGEPEDDKGPAPRKEAGPQQSDGSVSEPR